MCDLANPLGSGINLQTHNCPLTQAKLANWAINKWISGSAMLGQKKDMRKKRKVESPRFTEGEDSEAEQLYYRLKNKKCAADKENDPTEPTKHRKCTPKRKHFAASFKVKSCCIFHLVKKDFINYPVVLPSLIGEECVALSSWIAVSLTNICWLDSVL